MRLGSLVSRLVLPVALLSCVLTAPVRAALIAYEGFGYAPGAPLNGQNGGTGWAGGWFAGNPLAFITTPGLTFSGLDDTPGAVTATAKPNPPGGGDITFEQRQLATAVGVDGSTLYLSFLTRPETGFGFYGGLNLGGLFIGQSGPTTTYGLETSTIASSSVEAQVGETVRLVLRARFLAGNDIFDLFVNPAVGGPDPLVADATLTNFDLGLASIITINNAGAWTLDEIRIDAVPEPSAALLVAGGLMLAGLARRRGRRT